MAASGFIIVFATDADQPADHYWDGQAQQPLTSTTPLDSAKFYSNKSAARLDEANLLTRFPNQEIAIIPATMTIAATFAATPQVIAPIAPPV